MLKTCITKIAKLQGVSVSQIERELGFAPSSIDKWDDHAPSVYRVQAVADYLQVPIETLLNCEE